MKQFKKEFIKAMKESTKNTIERFKLLIIFMIVMITIIGGFYSAFLMLTLSGVEIIKFLFSAMGIWFGFGLIDMFRDMCKK